LRGILTDINVGRQRRAIASIWVSDSWRDLWRGLGLVMESFPALGLSYDSSDALVWRTCQRERLVLLTGNRNDEGPDSLEANVEQAATLWNATRILMGLRYEEEQVDAIMEGVTAMLFGIRGIEESSVYQGILRKGEAKGRAEGEAEWIREALLIQGRKKLGPPEEKTRAQIAEIHDLDRLKLLLERILDVSSWDELLAPGDASA
jgi:hypothetical protein